MKIISLIDDFNLRRRPTSTSLLLLSLFLFVSTLLVKAVEPGPEADGIYSCGKEVKGKYTELGKLEIKGKTYATYSENDKVSKEKKSFDSFKTDSKGRIEWSMAFNFLDSSTHMAGGTSEYSVDKDGKPSVLINYSENHTATFMICTKEK
jgi:hypothetical protein